MRTPGARAASYGVCVAERTMVSDLVRRGDDAMITFILLGAFFLIAVLFAGVAYTANNRRRANMRGVDASHPVAERKARAVTEHS